MSNTTSKLTNISTYYIMKRNGNVLQHKGGRKPTRSSIDISTQTENFVVEEDVTKLPVVLLDKSVIAKYIQQSRNQGSEHNCENEENSSRTIGRAITTTNYSTFLKPITNNQYANSTFESNKTPSQAPLIRRRCKRRVKFFRPNVEKRTRRKQCEDKENEEEEIRLSPMRDASCESERLETIPERTEIEQFDGTFDELNEEETNDNEVRSIEIGSTTNVCRMSLNAEIQNLIPNFRECEQRNLENIFASVENVARSSNKGTSTENLDTNEPDVKFGCIKFTANTINIHNHFYGRRNDLE